MKYKKSILLIFFSFLFLIAASAQGLLKRNGKTIIDGGGKEVILRGIGLGGDMLQEPYMLNISNTANQAAIRLKIEALIGKENTDTFYNAWLANYMTKADVDSLAAFGFNSIRLPMHYNLFTLPIEKEPVAGGNTWIDKGFVMVDSLLAWCKADHIYLILDMHATPGGQGKDAAISDYDATKPSLWESVDNRSKLIALWKKLAERYANEEWIGAYDLINEPNWDLDNSGNQNGCNCSKSDPLLNLYKDIITAIRQVDTKHIVIVEGNCWGNRYDGMNSIASFDTSLALSFHKYWNYNDAATISGILGLRNSLNVPLWCGESGENSNTWYTEAIQLLENNKIGWAWWTWKKFESTSGTNSVKETTDYTTVKNYLSSGGTIPAVDIAKKGLMEMTENLKISNCTINRSVVDAMFRQVKTADAIPYKKHSIPGKIYAVDYDLGRNGSAYFDLDTADFHVSTNNYVSWNSGYAYRNDGVDIQSCNDTENEVGYNVGWTNAGEWTQYTVNIDSTASYNLNFRYAGTNSVTEMHLSLDGIDVSGILSLPSTTSWTIWKTVTFSNLILQKGRHTLRAYTDKGGANLSSFEFLLSKNLADVPFSVVSAETSTEGSKVYVTLNKEIKTPLSTNFSDFKVIANNVGFGIQAISLVAGTTSQIEIDLATNIRFTDVVTITYTGSSIKDNFSKTLDKFSDLRVKNTLPIRTILPAKIEAENFYFQSGLTVETCSEGGQSIGYTSAGDYLDYRVSIMDTSIFSVDFRIAALAGAGKLEVQLIDAWNVKTILGSVSVPATGGWQTWKTISSQFKFPAGDYTLRIYIVSPEFNLNWFNVKIPSEVKTILNKATFYFYPDPTNDFLFVNLMNAENRSTAMEISDLEGRQLLQFKPEMVTNRLDVSNLSSGVYCLRVMSKNESSSALFIKK